MKIEIKLSIEIKQTKKKSPTESKPKPSNSIKNIITIAQIK